MKILKIILLALALNSFSAQSQVAVNVNLGKPPVWAPANPVQTQYYFLPDIDTYYDVPSQRFIYLRNGKWFRSAALPARYRGYNLKSGNVVYLTDYRGNSPYKYHKNHKIKYAKSSKVYVSKEKKYKGNNVNRITNGNGNAKPNGKGNGNGKGKK